MDASLQELKSNALSNAHNGLEKEETSLFNQIKNYFFFEKFSRQDQQQYDSFISMFCILDGQIGVYQIDKSHKKEKQVLVKRVNQNHCFGEQCLSTKSTQKWEYKCISSECTLLEIQRKELKRLFSTIKKEDIIVQLKFLSSMNAFSEYNSNLLLQIYSNSIEVKFQRNHTVFNEGEESNYIYIIKSGYFLVKSSLSDMINSEKDQNQKSSTSNQNTNQLVNKLLQKKKQVSKEQKIVIWGEKELFGEEDALEDKPRRYSVTCESTSGELIQISKDYFLSNIMQDDYSKDIILANLSQKLKLFEKKSQNALKQLYDSSLSKFYQQQCIQSVEPTYTPREVPQIQSQNANNNLLTISKPQSITFKALIKQKLIGYDPNFNSSQVSSRKENTNSSQFTEQIIPNISELINSSQVLSTGEQTIKNNNTPPHENNNGSNGSKTKRLLRQGSQGQISTFSQYTQNNQTPSQPFSNKGLLETIKKSSIENDQKLEFETELKRLVIVQPQECYWLQNQIESVNEEIISKDLLVPPEPFCTDAKIMETTPQIKKFYHDLKKNYFKRYVGKSKKTFSDFAQMRHSIRHRGLVQMIEEDMERHKSLNQRDENQVNKNDSPIPDLFKKSSQNKSTDSLSERRVHNIIKNKILKGNDSKFNEFRSSSLDLAFRFSQQSTMAQIQDAESSDLEDRKQTDEKASSQSQMVYDQTVFTSSKTSNLQSPEKKEITVLQKHSSENLEHKLQNQVSFQEDIQLRSKLAVRRNQKQYSYCQMQSMPELNDQSNKVFSFTASAQKSLLQNDSPIDSTIFDKNEIQIQSQAQLDKLNQNENILQGYSSQSHQASPIRQRPQIKDSLNTSPFITNLKKKYLEKKQRSISPRKQQNYMASLVSSQNVEQLKKDLILTQLNLINNSQKFLQQNQKLTFEIPTQTEQSLLNTDTTQSERLKPSIRSKSLIFKPSTASLTQRPALKSMNRSQSPINNNRQTSIENKGVKYLNFTEICQKVESEKQQEYQQQKPLNERNNSFNNLMSYNNKIDNLRSSGQHQYLGINNDFIKSVSPPKRRISEKGVFGISNKSTSSQITNQSNQLSFSNTKYGIQKLFIEKDYHPSQQIKTEGGDDETIRTSRNQHFSITNKFFDKLETKTTKDSQRKDFLSQQQSTVNKTILTSLNYHNNNTFQYPTSIRTQANKTFQKRVVQNILGNSNLLNTLDMSKIKKNIE